MRASLVNYHNPGNYWARFIIATLTFVIVHLDPDQSTRARNFLILAFLLVPQWNVFIEYVIMKKVRYQKLLVAFLISSNAFWGNRRIIMKLRVCSIGQNEIKTICFPLWILSYKHNSSQQQTTAFLYEMMMKMSFCCSLVCALCVINHFLSFASHITCSVAKEPSLFFFSQKKTSSICSCSTDT